MYSCVCPGLSWRVQPPARTAIRTFFASIVEAKSSAEKRWVHRSQWGSIPKKPLQTAVKMAACVMELGLKLCSVRICSPGQDDPTGDREEYK
jgi:hypothetical protein